MKRTKRRLWPGWARRERNISFHSWRHYFNSKLRIVGLPDNMVKYLVGHDDVKMTEHYTHFKAKDLRQVVSAQEEVFCMVG